MHDTSISHEDRELILNAAIRAAEYALQRQDVTPAEAAMQVVCAYLIADKQLNIASGEPLTSAVSDAVLKAVGLEPLDEKTYRAMRLLGLQPLLRLQTTKTESAPKKLGWFRRILRSI